MSTELITKVQPQRNRGGTWVRIADQEYRIPPLAFGALQEIGPDLEKMQGLKGVPSSEQMGAMSNIVLLALKRNYPDMTIEDVKDMLDLGNFTAVVGAVMGSSGFVRKEQAPGEAMASTGESSTSS